MIHSCESGIPATNQRLQRVVAAPSVCPCLTRQTSLRFNAAACIVDTRRNHYLASSLVPVPKMIMPGKGPDTPLAHSDC